MNQQTVPARNLALGEDNFEAIAKKTTFYVDKTSFISQWYNGEKKVTLITRPRRFGKTLTMGMVDRFFSTQYQGQPEPFLNLAINKDSEMMKLQGTIPVIALSFIDVQGDSYQNMVEKLSEAIRSFFFHVKYDIGLRGIKKEDVDYIENVIKENYDSEGKILPLPISTITSSLWRISRALYYKYKRKKVIITLDEYDTPLQSAYLNGYWNEASSLFVELFKSTFKGNAYLHKALITGITRVAKESLFPLLNNLNECSVTSSSYAETFGFTLQEVDAALQEYKLSDLQEKVKQMYDGYQFGEQSNMYNPWSVCNFLDKRVIGMYWANSASNEIVSYVIKNGTIELKDQFVKLIQGETVTSEINEEATYMTMLVDPDTIRGLLLSCGYLKAINTIGNKYTMAIVNLEVKEMIQTLIKKWFKTKAGYSTYNAFINHLVECNEKGMQEKLSILSRELLGIHDPEQFYHGFVLGIVASLSDRFAIESNRESGYGRYDIMLEPLDKTTDYGIVIEFKVFNPEKEKELDGTCARALKQIEEKQYVTELVKRGIPENRIGKFGIGYKGKEVLVKKG